MKCIYRIYPNWFGGEVVGPMRELADGGAKKMGRRVLEIEKVGAGFDRRSGHFVDYRVTYSSTEALGYEEIRK